MKPVVVITIAISFSITLAFTPILVDAHQSGCHGWHSCPSDSGSYTCGDTGYCSECYDNSYCKDRQVRGIEPVQSFDTSNSADIDNGTYFSPLRIGVIVFFVGLAAIAVIGVLYSNGKQKK